MITSGFSIAYNATMKFLDEFKRTIPVERGLLVDVARTALRTKLHEKLADHITECVVDAVLTIRKDEKDCEPDLHMIEIQVLLIMAFTRYNFGKFNMILKICF